MRLQKQMSFNTFDATPLVMHRRFLRFRKNWTLVQARVPFIVETRRTALVSKRTLQARSTSQTRTVITQHIPPRKWKLLLQCQKSDLARNRYLCRLRRVRTDPVPPMSAHPRFAGCSWRSHIVWPSFRLHEIIFLKRSAPIVKDNGLPIAPRVRFYVFLYHVAKRVVAILVNEPCVLGEYSITDRFDPSSCLSVGKRVWSVILPDLSSSFLDVWFLIVEFSRFSSPCTFLHSIICTVGHTIKISLVQLRRVCYSNN